MSLPCPTNCGAGGTWDRETLWWPSWVDSATQPSPASGFRRRSGATALPLSLLSPVPPLAAAMLSLPPVQKLLRPKTVAGGDTAKEVTSPVLATEAGPPTCYSALRADELRPLAVPKDEVATSTEQPPR